MSTQSFLPRFKFSKGNHTHFICLNTKNCQRDNKLSKKNGVDWLLREFFFSMGVMEGLTYNENYGQTQDTLLANTKGMLDDMARSHGKWNKHQDYRAWVVICYFEFAHETWSVFCRTVFWDCFGASALLL